ncbi:DUF488 domain-containing protein [Acidiferrobacter thiooxydans]|jgi:uncharacterized protein YeaO (DUF488 family)|uniref:DUF488 domain-containing protein n=1 Tax=Acidiferrobacter thiooxydans TaxID=163359 RepID=A0A1C2G1J8_9GAMM|nr:DUF488 family protein [Acidiferrobacter thiooxydans]RCN56599.1 DUF488 domain-containing protein [Acidiferrobacter thiooxydans]UEN99265.1 DUF488 family protein [Acidiferrobacter thiooxydans]
MKAERPPAITIRRVYESPEPGEGPRWLVDRIWPRGLTKAAAGLAGWAKDAAPSSVLRQWFGHEPERFAEFRRRYLAELRACPEASDALIAAAHAGPLVLVYAAHDETHNNAVVLREYLMERMRA